MVTLLEVAARKSAPVRKGSSVAVAESALVMRSCAPSAAMEPIAVARVVAQEVPMSKQQSSGPSAQNNQGIPSEGHGGSNKNGSGGNPQNTNTKGSGAQKRQQQKKR
jgi:hypothetical protein